MNPIPDHVKEFNKQRRFTPYRVKLSRKCYWIVMACTGIGTFLIGWLLHALGMF